MNGLVLLESLQYVDDRLLEEGSVPAKGGSPWLRWGAVAACAALLVCGGLLLRGALEGRAAPGAVTAGPGGLVFLPEPSGYITLPQFTEGDPASPQAGTQPVNTPRPEPDEATPGDLTPPPERGEPEVFSYDVGSLIFGRAVYGGEPILVSRDLTAEEFAACAPETLPAWAEVQCAYAMYALADGSGGLKLVGLQLRDKTSEYSGTMCTIQLRELTEELRESLGPEEDLPSIGGQAYRATREYEERPLYPDQRFVTIQVSFIKGNVLYTLLASEPGELEQTAAMDLYDVFLAYLDTRTTPDLGSFVYQEEG